MALSRTNVHGSISGTAGVHGTGAFTTASFTPPDSSLLVVGVALFEDAATTTDPDADFTISGGSLTYTKRVNVTVKPTGFPSYAAIFTAPVSTGASMTLTLDCGSHNIATYVASVVAYTGYNAGSPFGATGTATQNGGFGGPPSPFSLTLSGAPATSSEVFAVVSSDTALAGTAPGSGFTEIHDFTNTGFAGTGETEVRTGSTSTTVDWVDLRTGGGTLSAAAAVALEIRETPAAPGVFIGITKVI